MPEITRSQLFVYGAIALVVAILGARYLEGARASSPGASRAAGSRPPAGDGRAPTGGPQVIPASTAGGGLVVHVAGAVRHPGVYRLRAGSRVRDALRRAGGAARDGNQDAVNLAAKLADGQQVVIPGRSASPAAPGSAAASEAGGSAASAAPISLSSATVDQLDTLDGVGPATAQRIVAWRTEHGGFRSVDDLGQVPGIGPKRLAALRERVQP